MTEHRELSFFFLGGGERVGRAKLTKSKKLTRTVFSFVNFNTLPSKGCRYDEIGHEIFLLRLCSFSCHNICLPDVSAIPVRESSSNALL